ncbi:IS5 family transposase [Streptomyces sp. NPDC001904]|uniref:IS5 family transposase n=1 Tax=Streptomyces sp. NPDC001904 TaxID=3154531 RepID=UPI0033230BEC
MRALRHREAGQESLGFTTRWVRWRRRRGPFRWGRGLGRIVGPRLDVLGLDARIHNASPDQSHRGGAVPATPAEAIGRSRGGLSTKIHLAVDRRGRPLSIVLTPGQVGDNPQLLPVLDAIRINAPGPGRPRKRPDVLIADKGYAHNSTRAILRRRGISHVIPERTDQRARRASKGSGGGRPPGFDRALYRERNVVERCLARFKQYRDLATRYAKRAVIFRGSLTLIAAVIWLR